MKPLKNEFNKNEMRYKILKRTENTVLFEVFTETGHLIGYEVDPIIIALDRKIRNSMMVEREIIPSNERFGQFKYGGQFFGLRDIDSAELYYAEMNLRVSGTSKKKIMA